MYLYRFDTLKALLAQRRHDPVLRARRRDGTGVFGHHQVRASHLNLAADEAVYQLSFWKSFDALKANLWAHWDGSVIQRIRTDHPSLQSFQRGDDEYLAQVAWLYWGTFLKPSADPDWAPVGIPHADIDVLDPHGEWTCMEDVEVLSDKAGEGWISVSLSNGFRQYPIHAAQRTLANGAKAVLLRHESAGAFNHTYAQWQVIEFLINEGLIDGDPRSLSWYLAVELDEEIDIEEIKPTITQTKTPGLWGVIDRCRSIAPARKWTVDVPYDPHYLKASEIDDLYGAFGLEERLRRGKRWSYRNCPACVS